MAAARIVSLVPSLTEMLCDLGLREQLVGRTGFCIHPKELLRAVPKVGGTKTVDIEKLLQLKPTHLIVNVDENEKSTVEQLRQFVPQLVVPHPIAVADNLSLYERFGALFDVGARAAHLAELLQQEITLCAQRRFEPRTVLYLIWRAPWMTIAADTYIAQTLASVGLSAMAVPGRTERYPSFDWPQMALEHCDAVLLSSEPYRFTDRHVDQLASELAGCNRARPANDALAAATRPLVRLIDGEMTSWYGSRAILGLRYLRRFRDELDALWRPAAAAIG